MSHATSRTADTVSAKPAPGTRARDLHVAARAALIAAIIWLIEPILFALTLTNPDNMRMDQTLEEFRAANWIGILAGPAYIALGVTLAVMLLAISRVQRVAQRPRIRERDRVRARNPRRSRARRRRSDRSHRRRAGGDGPHHDP